MDQVVDRLTRFWSLFTITPELQQTRIEKHGETGTSSKAKDQFWPPILHRKHFTKNFTQITKGQTWGSRRPWGHGEQFRIDGNTWRHEWSARICSVRPARPAYDDQLWNLHNNNT